MQGQVMNVCPATIVDAAAERVWELITWPEGLEQWVDAELRSATPTGAAQRGQRILFTARAAGRGFPVTFVVREVHPEVRRLRLDIGMPFGVRNDETITVTETAPDQCLVRFG